MPDNPAYRLHSILKRMHEFNGLPESSQTKHALNHAVPGRRYSIGTSTNVRPIVYEVFELQKLIHQILEWIHTRDLDSELFKCPVERLWESLMGLDPESNWELTKKKINPDDVRALLYCSNEFEREAIRNAQQIDQEEMSNLVAEINALYNAVEKSDMPGDVKTFILEQLAVIKHAIRVYPYQGYESLQKALQQNIGATMLFSGRLDQVSKQYPEVSRWTGVMGKLSTVLTKAAEVSTIAQPFIPYITNLLGGGQPPK